MLQPITLLLSIGLSLTIGFALIIALISRPERGWIYYVVLLGLLPFLWEIASPLLPRTGATPPYGQAFLPIVILTMLIFVIWLCNQVILWREIPLEKGPLFYPFLFFILANVLSLFNAKDIKSGMIIISAWVYIFLAYLAIYNTINRFSYIESFVKIFITICVVLSIYGSYLWLLGFSDKGASPFGGSGMLESNHVGFILAEGLFLGMLLSMFSNQRFYFRIFYFISFLLIFFTLIFTFSRGAWVSCTVVLLWLAFIQSIKLRQRGIRLAGYALISLFIGFGIFYAHPDVHTKLLTIFKGAEASMSRYEMDVAAWRTFLDHPLVGVGVNNFIVYTHALGERASYGTCDLYSRMLAETGIFGFITFIALMITIYCVLSKGVRMAISGSKEQLIQLGFLAGFLANAIDFLFFGLIYPLPWIFFSIGIASTKLSPERMHIILNEES